MTYLYIHEGTNVVVCIWSTCRFGKVAKILNVSKVDMQVEVKTNFLSSNVIYAAYLVCKQVSHLFESPKLAGLKYKLNNQKKILHFIYSRLYGKWMGDDRTLSNQL